MKWIDTGDSAVGFDYSMSAECESAVSYCFGSSSIACSPYKSMQLSPTVPEKQKHLRHAIFKPGSATSLLVMGKKKCIMKILVI